MRLYLIVFLSILVDFTYAQTSSEVLKKKLNYYLPDISYDRNITTPEEYLGYQIGEWHVSHDQVVGYMTLLASQSDRIELYEYARSHEHRKLLTLYISSPENLKQKEEIKRRHNSITEDSKASIENLPAILYQGYSIHGNEPSGVNASMLVAYYLAAGQSESIKSLLANTFIILDPCYNPDGVTRFSTWANSHKGKNLISDPDSREYNEVWPGGRTNHYWFDLNRDWLLLTHPESKGRVKHFQEWKPNVLTDHHEMGTNSTFFFQPGVPSRVNPNTPWSNQELTEEIAAYHARALDSIGSLYYSKEGFDDFYYGKGSTYPDIHGGVGILFEQASSRGHYQESSNGILSFPFTIRNQVTTSLSTQAAVLQMKQKLLLHKRSFYAKLSNEAASNPIKGYIIFDEDQQKLHQMMAILLYHDVKIHGLTNDVTTNNHFYPKNKSYYIPLNQKQYKLVKTCFEKVTTFQDSIFYDVSAWTMPLAFDIQYDELNEGSAKQVSHSTAMTKLPEYTLQTEWSEKAYAIAVSWNQAYAPAFLNALLQNDIIVKSLFSESKYGEVLLKRGTLVIPMSNQKMSKKTLIEFLKSKANLYAINTISLESGFSANGISLGHPDLRSINAVKAFTIVGQGVSPYDAGELWHFMDQRLDCAISHIDKKDLAVIDLNRYNTLILVDGKYDDLSETFIKKLEEWVKKGNQIIGLSTSIEFLKNKHFVQLKEIEIDKTKAIVLKSQYEHADEVKGAKVLGGSIFNAEADMSHPLCFGLGDNQVALFKSGTPLYKITENEYASPLRYASKGVVLSGYVPYGFADKAKNSLAGSVHTLGAGTISCFADNALFRGYWWGGFKLFANALFFVKEADKETKEKWGQVKEK